MNYILPAKRILTTLTILLTINQYAAAQENTNCNCESTFKWTKETFEQNDAGFSATIQQKGKDAYEAHNQRFEQKVKELSKDPKSTQISCAQLMNEWLQFFRKGHIGFSIIQANNTSSTASNTQNFDNWEKFSVDMNDFITKMNAKKEADFEGIWEFGAYRVGIQKTAKEYIGFIINSSANTWTTNQVKLRFDGNLLSGTLYMRDHSAQTFQKIQLIGNNTLLLGNTMLKRVDSKFQDTPAIALYLKSISAEQAFLEQLNSKTLYLRIPSFAIEHKKIIDSVLSANKKLILSTENLIIDIKNGTGGSDASYGEIIPFLYTNPIRAVGLEFLSTKTNNQWIIDYLNNPAFKITPEQKTWLEEGYELLQNNIGQFVNVHRKEVLITELDTVYAFPKNIGIIANEGNGSSDEQFLLAAKQSKKVKIFGRNTQGVLDVSNMHEAKSPCNNFILHYALSRSKRLPQFPIDGIGIQPDFFIDGSIKEEDWISFVLERL